MTRFPFAPSGSLHSEGSATTSMPRRTFKVTCLSPKSGSMAWTSITCWPSKGKFLGVLRGITIETSGGKSAITRIG